MTLTREALAERARRRRREARKSVPFVERRNAELLLLILGALAVATGLWLVYKAKAAPAEQAVNLNALTGAPQLLTLLQGTPDSEYIADRIDEMRRRGFHFENDGALARLRIKESDLNRARGLAALKKRMSDAQARREERDEERPEQPSWFEKLRGYRPEQELTIPLLAPQQFAALKPSIIVRSPRDFRSQFLGWT